jgi:GT2 family glycosyltransferase
VTIIFVQRERFSITAKGLESLIANTQCPYELICVDCNSPEKVKSYLQQKCKEHGFTLLRSDDYLTPNEARNAAMEYVTTPYIAFVDNDIEFSDGWLEALINCAEETGAWLVGPLYLEGTAKLERIHMYGGEISIVESPTGKAFCEEHYLVKKDIDDSPDQLVRKTTGLLEFHTMLARTNIFDQVGPLDCGLMNVKDHSDLCYAVTKAGGTIYLEPSSRTKHILPTPEHFDEYDRDYYYYRWSDAWTSETIRTYCNKYDISPNSPGIKIQNYWCNKYRRKISAPFSGMRKILGDFVFRIIEAVLISPLELYRNRQNYSYEKCVENRKPTIKLVETS